MKRTEAVTIDLIPSIPRAKVIIRDIPCSLCDVTIMFPGIINLRLATLFDSWPGLVDVFNCQGHLGSVLCSMAVC